MNASLPEWVDQALHKLDALAQRLAAQNVFSDPTTLLVSFCIAFSSLLCVGLIALGAIMRCRKGGAPGARPPPPAADADVHPDADADADIAYATEGGYRSESASSDEGESEKCTRAARARSKNAGHV